jgi:hypothetical protein
MVVLIQVSCKSSGQFFSKIFPKNFAPKIFLRSKIFPSQFSFKMVRKNVPSKFSLKIIRKNFPAKFPLQNFLSFFLSEQIWRVGPCIRPNFSPSVRDMDNSASKEKKEKFIN